MKNQEPKSGMVRSQCHSQGLRHAQCGKGSLIYRVMIAIKATVQQGQGTWDILEKLPKPLPVMEIKKGDSIFIYIPNKQKQNQYFQEKNTVIIPGLYQCRSARLTFVSSSHRLCVAWSFSLAILLCLAFL